MEDSQIIGFNREQTGNSSVIITEEIPLQKFNKSLPRQGLLRPLRRLTTQLGQDFLKIENLLNEKLKNKHQNEINEAL